MPRKLRDGSRLMSIDEKLWRAAQKLSEALEAIEFGAPVTHVYNPLRYAARPHREYLRRYASTKKEIVLLGMNPGPFGMAQTGVPFGEVALVRDFLGIEAKVDRPAREHPARPIEGFACKRSEVSGARLWGALAERHKSASKLFERRFVANYCPLVFMEESGKNRTPDKLAKAEQKALLEACDAHLRTLCLLLEPRWVIGVGGFAQASAERALEGMDVKIATILHPSPASPMANRGWAEQADKQMRALGLEL
jgi:single-strand selective monofunctional uracil DNA glycosylase